MRLQVKVTKKEGGRGGNPINPITVSGGPKGRKLVLTIYTQHFRKSASHHRHTLRAQNISITILMEIG